jgi:hypothetical protein
MSYHLQVLALRPPSGDRLAFFIFSALFHGYLDLTVIGGPDKG